MQKILDETGLIRVNENINQKVSGKVLTTRTVNNKALTADIALTAQDVGAISEAQMNTAIQTAIKDTWASAF